MQTLPLIVILFLTLSFSVNAQTLEDQTVDSRSPIVVDSSIIQLAAADTDKAASNMSSSNDSPMEYKNRWFTSNKVHQYLGIGSISLALMAAVAPKPAKDEDGGVHHSLAEGAAALGGLAVGTGLAFHYKDLSFRHGFKNPDNWHALLGTIAAVGFLVAVDDAPEGGHAGVGLTSAAAMLTAIKITW